MKNGVSVLNHDTGYRNMKKDLVKRYGKEETELIWAKAGRNWEELCEKYDYLPKKVKAHTDGQMFRMAALYMAVREKHPSDAMHVLESGVEKEGRRVAGMLSALLHIPGMQRMAMVIFKTVLDTSFGEEAGFQSTMLCSSGEEVRLDIHQCPYCKYLTEIGCPEIIHFSCDIDDIIYGQLPGLEFRRTGTLGKGADRCDFCLRRAKR